MTSILYLRLCSFIFHPFLKMCNLCNVTTPRSRARVQVRVPFLPLHVLFTATAASGVKNLEVKLVPLAWPDEAISGANDGCIWCSQQGL